MTRLLCGAFLLASLTLAVGTGCGSKNEGQPNPDLKIPDVPKGERSGGGGIAPGEKETKKPKKGE